MFDDTFDVVTAAATVIAALAGAWAAIAASIAARASRMAAEAALLKEFSDSYMDNSMNESLYILRHWADEHGPDYGKAWWEALGARRSSAHPEYQRAVAVDQARQKVKGYFATADRLYQLGAISHRLFRTICDVYAVNVFIDIVQSLEQAERPSWQPLLADRLQRLGLRERTR
jgi:hypothetical protein